MLEIPTCSEENAAPPPGPFVLDVDPKQQWKAKELKICSIARPHMRAFHYSWWSVFMAKFVWFSIAPLLPEIKISLGLTSKEIWLSNIIAVSGDIVMRFFLGSITDKMGSRILMGCVLIFASIPTACTGLVNNLIGLCLLRLFIGCAGSSFIISQCWTMRMFTKEVAGTATSLVGGWGGAGCFTQIIMGALLFPFFRDVFFANAGDPSEKAWRTVCVIPAIVTFLTGVIVILTSDDCPEGNYTQLIKEQKMKRVSSRFSFSTGVSNTNTWLLFIQYGCCFGVDLTMNNAATTYFVERFHLSTSSAAAIASVFGVVNIFARAFGGYCSDWANHKFGIQGRIWLQFIFLLLQGIFIILFPLMETLWSAIMMLTILFILALCAQGSTYGIVPYVNPKSPGGVAGMVGAGGPSAAVVFGFGFMFLNKTEHAYFLMGGLVILGAMSCLLINIQGSEETNDETRNSTTKFYDEVESSVEKPMEEEPSEEKIHVETRSSVSFCA